MIALYKKTDGNLVERTPVDAEQEETLREQGFMTLEQLFPDPKAKKGKK